MVLVLQHKQLVEEPRIANNAEYERFVKIAADRGFSVFSDGNHLYASRYALLSILEISDEGVQNGIKALEELPIPSEEEVKELARLAAEPSKPFKASPVPTTNPFEDLDDLPPKRNYTLGPKGWGDYDQAQMQAIQDEAIARYVENARGEIRSIRDQVGEEEH